MIVEKGGYRMNLSVSGRSRDDCVVQLKREFFPQQVALQQIKDEGPKKVSLSKLDLVKLVHNYSGEKGSIEAKRFIENNYPQFDQP